jgi:hypothetical protein
MARALVYRNTKHTIPGWVPFQQKEPRGIAYETDTHSLHIFGKASGLWVISTGLTVTEKKDGSLRDWVIRTFGAEGIEETVLDVDHTIDGVWRPGLYYLEEVLVALNTNDVEFRLAEQALLLLVQRLDELLTFVEPSKSTLATYSHKARELLILACTEVEHTWQRYLRKASLAAPTRRQFTTNDYIKLKAPLFLDEYEVGLPRYPDISLMRPFAAWSLSPSPTKTLRWYEAYNSTKHNRSRHFSEATLGNCLEAVAANIVLFSVSFGPLVLFHGRGSLSTYFNQLFSLGLKGCDPRTFYAPMIALPENQRTDLICYNAQEAVQPRVVQPLKL